MVTAQIQYAEIFNMEYLQLSKKSRINTGVEQSY